jgi:hypothetical protein
VWDLAHPPLPFGEVTTIRLVKATRSLKPLSVVQCAYAVGCVQPHSAEQPPNLVHGAEVLHGSASAL